MDGAEQADEPADQDPATPTAEEPTADPGDDDTVWTAPSVRGYRSRVDSYVAGIFGGIGERFGVDPLYLRLAAVVVVILLRDGPVVVVPILYALAWIVVPAENESSLLATIRQRESLQEIAAAGVLAALVSVVVASSGLWPVGALAVAGWFLLRQPLGRTRSELGMQRPYRRENPDVSGEGSPAQPPPVSQPGGTGYTAQTNTEQWGPSAGAPSAEWGRSRRGVSGPLESLRQRPRRTRRPRRQPALWPLTLALLVVVGVILATVESSTSPGADPATFVNLALLVIGGVMILSGWRGRAGWTSLLVLPLLPLWVAFSAADIGRFDGSGDVDRSIEAFPESGTYVVENGYGTIDLDVGPGAVPEGEHRTIETKVTAGSVNVYVPHDLRLIVDSKIGLGGLNISNNYGPDGGAFLVDGTRRRIVAATIPACHRHEVPYSELPWLYGENIGKIDVSPPAVLPAVEDAEPALSLAPTDPVVTTVPAGDDFFDEDLVQEEPEQVFADDEMPQEVPTELPADLRAQIEAAGLPMPQPVAPGMPFWIVHMNNWGEPCDPNAEPPENPGTLEIKTTAGIGEVNIVRSL